MFVRGRVDQLSRGPSCLGAELTGTPVGLAHAPATGCGWLAGMLGGQWSHAGRVCLTQLAPEIRESRAAERQSFCTHSNGPTDYAHPL